MICEWIYGTHHCDRDATLIIDCDECKNIFVCNPHVGAMICRHGIYCDETLHVDQIPGPWAELRKRFEKSVTKSS